MFKLKNEVTNTLLFKMYANIFVRLSYMHFKVRHIVLSKVILFMVVIY